MPSVFIVANVFAGALFLIYIRLVVKRLQLLERDVHHISEVVLKIADVQTKTFSRFSSRFEEMEERIMDLSVPSQDASLPLERRHRVLALARQGMATEDIARRLKAPLGETELILNLRKYLDRGGARPTQAQESAGQYV